MRNSRLVETQAGIKIAGRNINNHRYADDTTLKEERWKRRRTQEPLDKVKEGNEKCWLKTQHSKTKIMASSPITSWQIDGEKVETVTDFIFLVSKITADGDCRHEIKRCLLLEKKKKNSYGKPRQHIKKQRHHFASKGPYSQSYAFFQWSCIAVSVGL